MITLRRRGPVLPARADIAIKSVMWWQAVREHNHAHLQTRAAIWGLLPDGPQTLTTEGVLAHTANPFAVAGLSGTEDFFKLWGAKHFSVVSIFDDGDVRDSFQRIDLKLVRTAAFSNQTLLDTLTERTIPRFDLERTERCV